MDYLFRNFRKWFAKKLARSLYHDIKTSNYRLNWVLRTVFVNRLSLTVLHIRPISIIRIGLTPTFTSSWQQLATVGQQQHQSPSPTPDILTLGRIYLSRDHFCVSKITQSGNIKRVSNFHNCTLEYVNFTAVGVYISSLNEIKCIFGTLFGFFIISAIAKYLVSFHLF